ncbi:hypothetical protein VTJ04DRAFT_5598 [Mycothermus thermophilus]|uniref:uncharacterized protein n=1 Tax=Humicola insolens TaxID=85995 RepID=UPI003743AA3F
MPFHAICLTQATIPCQAFPSTDFLPFPDRRHRIEERNFQNAAQPLVLVHSYHQPSPASSVSVVCSLLLSGAQMTGLGTTPAMEFSGFGPLPRGQWVLH